MSSAANAELPMFYRHVVVPNAQSGAWRLKHEINLLFARQTAYVPLALDEIVVASRFYPVCFLEHVRFPVAMLGLKPGQNLFVDEAGRWAKDAYVPAYVRRYPFILVESGPQRLTLALENDKAVLDPEAGWPLFEGETPSGRGLAAFEFCRSYLAGLEAAASWADDLRKADLLVDRRVALSTAGAPSAAVEGFKTVDPEKLAGVGGDTLSAWARRGWLGPVFAHVDSKDHWLKLFALSRAEGDQPAEAKAKGPGRKLS